MAALCAWTSAALADDRVPEELEGAPIVEVAIEGPVARSTPVRLLGIPVGAPLRRAILRRTIRRLVATGRWLDVQFDAYPVEGGARLVARLRPRVVLLRVDVFGGEVFDAGQVRRALRLNEGSSLAEGTLDEAETRLREAYAARGYERMNVAFTVRETDDPAVRVLIVRVSEGEPTRVARVRVEGDSPPEGVQGALNVDVGDRFERERLRTGARAARRRLRELGYYEARLRVEDVHVQEDGDVEARFSLRLGPRYELRIAGHGPLDRDELQEAMRLEEDRLTRGGVRSAAARVRERIHRQGYADATVELLPVRAREPQPGFDAVLLLRIELGERRVVEGRRFVGAHHFSSRYLDTQTIAILEETLGSATPFDPVDDHNVDRLFSEQERARLGNPPAPVDPGSIWHAESYAAAATHLQELYQADGFLSAEVGPARLEDHTVVLPVHEGPRTFIYEVGLEGASLLSPAEVLEASRLQRGDAFSYLTLEEAKDRIRTAYQERGYYYASVESEVAFSADRTRAAVVLRVRERFEVRIRDVVLTGNVRTDEGLIRRVLDLEEGDLLTPSLLRSVQDRLLALGVFSGVSATPADPELPEREKQLVITLTERRSQYLDFRPGVSTAQGVRVRAEYGIRNLLGRALGLSLSAQFGYQFFFLDNTLEERFNALSLEDRLERRIVLAFSIPYVGLPDTTASLSLTHMRENERNFGITVNTADVTLTWRPRRFLNISYGAGLENNSTDLFGGQAFDDLIENTTDPRLRQLLRVPEGVSTLVAVLATLTLDRRDSPFTPTRGYLLSGSAEWARTIRDAEVERAGTIERFESHHFRFVLSASAYAPLGRKFVFATQLRFGAMAHLNDASLTYPNRQFFLGGVDTLRGYLQDSMVPQDIADEICDPSDGDCALPDDFNINAVVQGGDIFLVLRGELRFPIYGSLRGGAFLDVGNSWVDPSEFNPRRIRPTAGFGLRIETPVGPIAFDYGFLLLRRRFLAEPIGSFHFSIGLF
ncbi:MAG: POTRA domain-containing protein [Myxococcota bacterium]